MHPRPTATRQPANPIPRAAFTSICAACETVRITPDPFLPSGWQVEEIGGEVRAYCPDCAIDLPETAQ